MNTETLNREYLKALGACKEGIDAVINNNLEDFPINRLQDIQGDYCDFKNWMLDILISKREYDTNGNLIKVTYPSGKSSNYEYDTKGNLIKMTSCWGFGTNFEYNSEGNKTKQIEPNGDVITYEYDSRGNNIKTNLPSGDVTNYEYDTKGNLTKVSYHDKTSTKLEYDSRGNLIKKTYSHGKIYTWQFMEDDNFLIIIRNSKVICKIPLDYRKEAKK